MSRPVRQFVCPPPAHFGMLFLMGNASGAVGRRVVVTGMPGSGKSTFSRALSARTGLPVIHLDLRYWKPNCMKPSDDEWRVKQCSLLADDAWIADGNYHETLDLRLERADTDVVLDTPWCACAGRAFVRRAATGCKVWYDSSQRGADPSDRTSVRSDSPLCSGTGWAEQLELDVVGVPEDND
jgi:AAA domain